MKHRAISPVISSIILSAMVLIVGGGVWAYSKGAASVVANDYAYNTIEMINTIQEKFVIEHTSFDNVTHFFSLWIYNYGDVAIDINSKININETYYYNNSIIISKDSIKLVTFDIGKALPINEQVSIYVFTNRGNYIRGVYYVK